MFERAFVANPICMPNRSTVITRRLPSLHGTRLDGISLDGISLDRDAATFPRELRRAGYRTRLVGRAHVQNMGGSRHQPDGLRASGARGGRHRVSIS